MFFCFVFVGILGSELKACWLRCLSDASLVFSVCAFMPGVPSFYAVTQAGLACAHAHTCAYIYMPNKILQVATMD